MKALSLASDSRHISTSSCFSWKYTPCMLYIVCFLVKMCFVKGYMIGNRRSLLLRISWFCFYVTLVFQPNLNGLVKRDVNL